MVKFLAKHKKNKFTDARNSTGFVFNTILYGNKLFAKVVSKKKTGFLMGQESPLVLTARS